MEKRNATRVMATVLTGQDGGYLVSMRTPEREHLFFLDAGHARGWLMPRRDGKLYYTDEELNHGNPFPPLALHQGARVIVDIASDATREVLRWRAKCMDDSSDPDAIIT